MILSPEVLACGALVEKSDPGRFRIAMAAPIAARAVLFPLYAFNLEVARAPWVTQEPMIAEMRLQWWRDVCEDIAAGVPARRHDVAAALAAAITPEAAHTLDELVAARRWDIYKDPFEDAGHLARYIDATAGHLMWVAASTLGPADETVVRDAAWAEGVARWLRAIPDLEARGRLPLADGTPDAVRDLAAQALSRLESARRNRHKVSGSARPALFAVGDAAKVLRIAVEAPGRVVAGQLPQPGPAAGLRFAARVLSGRW